LNFPKEVTTAIGLDFETGGECGGRSYLILKKAPEAGWENCEYEVIPVNQEIRGVEM